LKKPKAPGEPAEAKRLRDRQVSDLAQLDEEQNVRIKQLFRPRQGGRAFRTPLGQQRQGARTTEARAAAAAASAGPGGTGASSIPDGFGRSNPFGIGF